MWKDALIRLLLPLLEWLVELAVVRLTVRFCIGAFCKWTATTMVEALFSHHAGSLYILSWALNIFLLCFCLDMILETLEQDLKIPVRRWLDRLYDSLIQKGGSPYEPPQLPESRKKPTQLKTKVVKRPKTQALRHSNAAPDAPDTIPAVVTPAAKPRRAPRRNKNQALKD